MEFKQGGYIICGYGGVGKSSLVKLLKKSGDILIDLDSGAYSKSPIFPKNYLDALSQVMENSPKKPWILCSTHLPWLEMLQKHSYHYVLVCPSKSITATEWEEERYINRDNPEGYIEAMRKNYNQYLDDMHQHAEGNSQCTLITLDKGQYLVDVFPKIRDIYNHLENA